MKDFTKPYIFVMTLDWRYSFLTDYAFIDKTSWLTHIKTSKYLLDILINDIECTNANNVRLWKEENWQFSFSETLVNQCKNYYHKGIDILSL